MGPSSDPSQPGREVASGPGSEDGVGNGPLPPWCAQSVCVPSLPCVGSGAWGRPGALQVASRYRGGVWGSPTSRVLPTGEAEGLHRIRSPGWFRHGDGSSTERCCPALLHPHTFK